MTSKMATSSRPPKADPQNTVRAAVFMTLLAVQFGWQPIANREYISKEVIITVTVLVTEGSKLVLALFMLAMENSWGAFKGWRLMESLQCAALPSAIYALQNLLMQTAYRNLDFVTFNLLNQSKLFSAALFIYLFMGIKQSLMQCLALVMLMSGAVLITSDTASSSGQSTNENKFWEGVVPVMLASLLSGFSGALSQVALQGRKRNSYLYTMELASYSILTLLVMTALTPNSGGGAGEGASPSDTERILAHGVWHGWTALTWIAIISNALGGIFVGQVTKYAGGVNKGFAIIVGILLTTFLQSVTYGSPIPAATWAAMPLIAAAIATHAAS